MPETPGDAAPAPDGGRSPPADGAAFDLGGTPADASFPPGTSLLLTGPPTVEKRPLLTDLLTGGWTEGSGVVGPPRVVADWAPVESN